MRSPHWLLSLVVSLTLGACSCAPPPADRPDAGGAPQQDAGQTPDAGVPDAGTEPDAGVVANPLQGAWREDLGLPGATGQGAQLFVLARGPDGRLYAGGIFEEVGGVPARNIAVWDGADWAPLGAGRPGPVRALAFLPDGTLYAGGDTLDQAATPNLLARWDGTGWEELPGVFDVRIHALAVQGTSVLVGGSFTQVGEQATAGLVRFDGTSFSPVGGGVEGEVHALHVVDGQTFCMAGVFSAVAGVAAQNVACWDGEAWAQLGDGLPGEASSLVRDEQGNWLAAGTLTFVTDMETGDYRAGLARLREGVWEPLAGGVDDGFINNVRALALLPGGGLAIGGDFQRVGKGLVDLPVRNLARLVDDTWSDVGGGVVNEVGVFGIGIAGVHALLAEEDGGLVVGGVFSRAGQALTLNLARFDGDAFVPLVAEGRRFLGVSGFTETMGVDGRGRVVVGGRFAGAGGVLSPGVARLDGEAWQPLGDGLDGIVRAVVVRPNGTVVAGGEFFGSGGQPMPFLAIYDGSSWGAFTPPLDGPVLAMAIDTGGALYLAGDFVTAGEQQVHHVVRWDGHAFEGLGAGLDGTVTKLALGADGRLYAAGFFTASGETPLPGLAQWDGTSWTALGSGGTDGWVSRLVVHGDNLYVAGHFEELGGEPIQNLARWDGEDFYPVGPRLSSELDFTLVTSVVPYGAGFFVGGIFDMAGDVPARHVAWFDGERYHPLGQGLSDLPEQMHVVDDRLFVLGTFVRADGRPSSGLAIWDFQAP